MAWTKGPTQGYRYDYSARRFNAELKEIEDFLPEGEAKYLLYKFLRNNIGYTTEVFFGMRLFPFQEMLIKSMMIGDFSMFVLSRGMSKTWSAAIYVLLQLMFRQGIKIGVISSSFRQAKMILQKSEDIINKPAASLVKDLYIFKKGTDQWTLTCGTSQALALPLADGSRLRGFRFSILLLDEFLNIPKCIFEEVIIPFIGVIDNPTEREDLRILEDRLIASGKMQESERYRWTDNKLILLSSPSYTFEYMYELYCLYRDLILGTKTLTPEEKEAANIDTDPYRIVFQLSYDCAPPDLYDKNQLQSAKATMSEAAFNKEFGGQFVSESDSYFKLSKMAACTVPIGESPHVEIVGNPSDEYIVAIDPSWSEDSGSDDFAMSVFKLLKDEQKACLVHAYGVPGTSLKNHIQYFHYLVTHFNVQTVVMDYAGGQTFLSACNESEIFKKDGIFLGVIDEIEDDFDKAETYHADLIKFKKALAPTQKKYVFLRKPSNQWNRAANELLQANIDHKRILFASQAIDASHAAQRKAKIPIGDLKWLREKNKQSSHDSAILDFLDHQVSMLELTKQQAANIEITTNPQGSQTFRLPPHMSRQTGPNRPRRDSYSALVLGNWMAKIYFDSINAKADAPVVSTFIPRAF